MEIPECYGQGIYEYWKKRKNALKILSDGFKSNITEYKWIGGLLTGAIGIDVIIKLCLNKEELVIFPFDQCLSCRLIKGCFSSAMFLLGDEINEELKK